MKLKHSAPSPTPWDASHSINIPSLKHEADGLQIEKHLKQLPGVSLIYIHTQSQKIKIFYDQRLIDFGHIQRKLEDIGFPALDTWWSRKKASWFQFMDANAKDNATAPPPPCCSNPKGLNKNKKKV